VKYHLRCLSMTVILLD